MFLREDGANDRPHAARRRSCATSTTSRPGSGSTTSRSAPTSTVPRFPTSSEGSPGSRGSSTRFAARATTTTSLAKITHGNWLRVLGEHVAALVALLPARRPRRPADADRRRRPVSGAWARRRSRCRHRSRHARAAAPRLEGDRDRRPAVRRSTGSWSSPGPMPSGSKAAWGASRRPTGRRATS